MITNQKICLKPVEPDDRSFFLELYADSRSEEVGSFGWNETQVKAFIEMQFAARQKAYSFQYPNNEDHVILLDDKRAGRLIIDRSKKATVIVDIAIATKFRRKGISSHVIRSLQEGIVGGSLVLRVDKINLPAFELYKKLGFKIMEENQIMYSMSWTQVNSFNAPKSGKEL